MIKIVEIVETILYLNSLNADFMLIQIEFSLNFVLQRVSEFILFSLDAWVHW